VAVVGADLRRTRSCSSDSTSLEKGTQDLPRTYHLFTAERQRSYGRKNIHFREALATPAGLGVELGMLSSQPKANKPEVSSS
jgi:hypothetical protein